MNDEYEWKRRRRALGEKEVITDKDQGAAIATVHEKQLNPARKKNGTKSMTGAGTIFLQLQVHPPTSFHLTFTETLRQVSLLSLSKEGNQGSQSYSARGHRAVRS